MRRAIWMALALGTAPLVALAQQNTGAQAPATQQPAGSPSGAASIDRGQDTNAIDAAGAPGQQSAGTVGTAQGQPATGGAGTGGGGAGGGGVGAGGGGMGGMTGGGAGMTGGQTGTGAAGADTAGPTYRGTSDEIPPPADRAGGGTGGAGQGGGGGGTAGGDVGAGGTGGAGAQGAGGSGAGGGGGSGGGQASAQVPMSGDAMQREITFLRERVTRLERLVGDQGRGTGGGGTGGGGTGGGDTGGGGTGGGGTGGGGTGGGGTTDTSNIRAEGPIAVATVTFDGTVRAVSSNRIQVVDPEDGSVYNLRIGRGTRVVDDGKAINPRQLSEGAAVRTSLEYIDGEEHARAIVVIDEQPQPRQQQQRQPQPRPEGMGPGQRMMLPQAPPSQGEQPGPSTR